MSLIVDIGTSKYYDIVSYVHCVCYIQYKYIDIQREREREIYTTYRVLNGHESQMVRAVS